MLWPIFLLLVVVYTIMVRWKNRKFHKIHKQLPTSMKQFPIFGHALHYLGNGVDRMNVLKSLGKELVEQRDGICSGWLVNKFFVVIADPEAAEVVMKTCLEKDDLLKISRVLLGNGSIFAPVHLWRPRRKILNPIFGHRTVNSFQNTFSTQSEILMEQLKTVAGKGDFSIFDKIAKYSIDTICENILGVKVKAQSTSSHPVPLAFNQFCSMFASRLIRPWFHSDAIYQWTRDYPEFERLVNILKEFVVKVIKSKRNEMSQRKNDALHQEDSKTKSLLELMMEADEGLNDLELQDESLVVLLAGTDTTSLTSSYMCLLLAKYPEVQEKVYQEIKDVLGDAESHIEPYDLPKFKYLEAVIKETLRLYPPGPLIFRKVEKNVTLPSGVTLVPGVGVVLHIWATQRNPKYWGPDANVFRPERFLEGPLKHPYAFMALSNGPRNCVGSLYAMTTIKTLMSYLIRKYRILPSSSSDNTEDGLPTAFEVTMKHVHNFKIQLELRNKENY